MYLPAPNQTKIRAFHSQLSSFIWTSGQATPYVYSSAVQRFVKKIQFDYFLGAVFDIFVGVGGIHITIPFLSIVLS